MKYKSPSRSIEVGTLFCCSTHEDSNGYLPMPVNDTIEEAMQRCKYGMQYQEDENCFPRYQLIQSVHCLKEPRQIKDSKIKHGLPKRLL